MGQETRHWAKVVLWGVLLLGLAAIGTLGQHIGELFEGFVQSKSPSSAHDFSPTKAAGLAASIANAGLPPGTEIGEDLVSEGASADGSHITYSYRFRFLHDQVNPDWIAEMSTSLPAAYCQKMMDLVEVGVSAEWRYVDSDGNPVFSVRAEPEDCQSDQ